MRTLGITYVKDPNLDKRCLLRGCSDASFNSEEGAKSVTGFVFTCAGGAITWGSRKQSLTALSAMEAECLALTEATQEAVWLRTLLEELKLPQTLPTPMQEDNELFRYPRPHSFTAGRNTSYRSYISFARK